MVRVIDQHSDQLFIDMRRATQLIQRLIAGSLSSTISATCVSISAELLVSCPTQQYERIREALLQSQSVPANHRTEESKSQIVFYLT